ncbi:MAG: ribosome maturation factor RimP [Pseudomonadota bacterium]
MNIASIIEETVTGMGYELVDIELSPRGRLIRVFMDCTAEAGRPVNVEDCALVSNQLTRLFAVENIDYDRLEISSPGLDRPLTRPAHFERFVGEEAQIRVRVPVAGQRNFTGVLKGVAEGKVCLETATGLREFEFDQIDKARLVVKF